MTIAKRRSSKIQGYFSVNNRAKVLLTCSCGALLLLLSAFVFLPEFLDTSFAEGGYNTLTSAISLVLSPVKENREDYKIIFNSPKGVSKTEFGSFGTVGIKANVTTANAYGYSLFIRSGSTSARLIYNNPKFSSTAGYTEHYYSGETEDSRTLNPAHYIPSISDNYTVESSSGSGWLEMNTYGWSKDWNPTTSRGTFKPMETTDQLVKKSVRETYQQGQEVKSEETRVYIGALVNDRIMPGNYRGSLIFTAITNTERSADRYTLNYDLNGGTGTTFESDFEDVEIGAEPPTFTISSEEPVHPEGLNFLGWNTNCYATEAIYQPSDIITPTSTDTTLCAIWEGVTVNRSFTTVKRVTKYQPSSGESQSSEEKKEESGPTQKDTSNDGKTDPLGEVVYEKDNGGALIIAIVCGIIVMLLTFFFLLFMKRRKEEEEELSIEE